MAVVLDCCVSLELEKMQERSEKGRLSIYGLDLGDRDERGIVGNPDGFSLRLIMHDLLTHMETVNHGKWKQYLTFCISASAPFWRSEIMSVPSRAPVSDLSTPPHQITAPATSLPCFFSLQTQSIKYLYKLSTRCWVFYQAVFKHMFIRAITLQLGYWVPIHPYLIALEHLSYWGHCVLWHLTFFFLQDPQLQNSVEHIDLSTPTHRMTCVLHLPATPLSTVSTFFFIKWMSVGQKPQLTNGEAWAESWRTLP